MSAPIAPTRSPREEASSTPTSVAASVAADAERGRRMVSAEECLAWIGARSMTALSAAEALAWIDSHRASKQPVLAEAPEAPVVPATPLVATTSAPPAAPKPKPTPPPADVPPSRVPPLSRRARVTRWIGTGGAAFLGMVLLVAAWTKMIDPESFAEVIRVEGLDFLLPASAIAFLALAGEVGLGLALVTGIRRLWVLLPTAGLTAFFLFLTGRTYVMTLLGHADEGHSCGCFGRLVERTPAEAFWQDAVLLVPALTLAFFARPVVAAFPLVRTIVAGAATVAALVFAGLAPDLPLDDLATRLKPGLRVKEICAGSADEKVCVADVIPLLEDRDSRHFVVISELDASVAAKVSELNDYVLRSLDSEGKLPMLWIVTQASTETIQRFKLTSGPAFEIQTAPASLLRPLYRRLPRSFRVVDGRVTETYDGWPPLESPPP